MTQLKPPPDDELDFTRPGALQTTPPTPQQAESARKEAEIVKPQLQASGFYVSIARHSDVRIPPRGGGKHVLLVVEDESDLGQLLIDVFMTAGFEVRWASNRAEINTELKRGADVDLVLLDIVLPDADGLQLLRVLRAHPRFANLPVIMMTGKSTVGDVQAGLAAGADGYVSKPFQMSGLVKAVNLVLGRV
jgi:two-component system, OmpR family, response regulator